MYALLTTVEVYPPLKLNSDRRAVTRAPPERCAIAEIAEEFESLVRGVQPPSPNSLGLLSTRPVQAVSRRHIFLIGPIRERFSQDAG